MPIILIIVLAVASLVIIVIVTKKPSMRKEVLLFDDLASKWNGKIDSNKDGPFFIFNYGDNQVCVSNQWSKLEKPIRYSKAVMKVDFKSVKQINVFTKELFIDPEALYPSMPSLRIGEVTFWSKFDVQADDIAFARSLVDRKIQKVLFKCHHQKPVVRVQSDKVEVSLYRLPVNEKECDNLIDLLLAFYDKIRDNENMAMRNML